MSHTPGPWTTRELSGDDHRGMGWIEADGRDISPYGDAALWMEQNRANGTLMAAAPDLLAIAREYASQCVNCNGSAEIIKNDRGGDPIDDRAEPCPACKDIWGVIDRATKP